MVDSPDDQAPELAHDSEEEGRRKSPSETYERIEPSPLPAMAPDGGPAIGGIGQPAPLPTATADNFKCLRGPCRYYWELHTHIASGNPARTWDVEDGLKTMMECSSCSGTGETIGTPQLYSAALAHLEGAPCGYAPTQGLHMGKPCRLVANHAGAHYHAEGNPPPRVIPCPTCHGTRVVPDPDGKPIEQPRQITRSCLRQPGVDTDLTEDLVYDCNLWDPVQPDERDALEKRRARYLKLHPEHRPGARPSTRSKE